MVPRTNMAVPWASHVAALATLAALASTMFVASGGEAVARADITMEGHERCIIGDGLPDHATGSFPNRGNPNSIRAQKVRLCVPMTPAKGRAKDVRGSVGVGLNGVQFRPGTADFWDPSSRRGFSRRRNRWNLEGLGAADALGMDSNNAHVDRAGLYHYHGPSRALARSSRGTLIGYAADGFEVHYLGANARSGWALKQGERTGGPGGRYDGTYVSDFHFVGGAGRLDRCNGGTLNGKFVYFATDTFPFFPRCLYGQVSRDFRPGRR